jgi:hypothetical protein
LAGGAADAEGRKQAAANGSVHVNTACHDGRCLLIRCPVIWCLVI